MKSVLLFKLDQLEMKLLHDIMYRQALYIYGSVLEHDVKLKLSLNTHYVCPKWHGLCML